MLYLKHRLAMSGAAEHLDRVREAKNAFILLKRPELGLRKAEKGLMRRGLSRLLAPDSDALDIGAHIGSVAAEIKRRAPRGRCLLFEPTLTKSRWLIRSFGAQSVIQAAVSDRPGRLPFIDDRRRPGFSRLARPGEAGAYDVDVVRLDDTVPEDFRPGLVKIDVEGHELPALRGGEAMLDRCRPVILFEAGAIGSDTPPQEEAALYDWLREKHYLVYTPMALVYGKSPCTAAQFRENREFPFQAFNYFALPAEGAAAFGVKTL